MSTWSESQWGLHGSRTAEQAVEVLRGGDRVTLKVADDGRVILLDLSTEAADALARRLADPTKRDARTTELLAANTREVLRRRDKEAENNRLRSIARHLRQMIDNGFAVSLSAREALEAWETQYPHATTIIIKAGNHG